MKFLSGLFFMLPVILCVSCSPKTTTLLGSWTDPERPEAAVERILVVGASDREQVRRTFERSLRDRINASSKATAIASLEEMKVDEELSEAALREHFNGKNIKAVLVTRVVDAQNTAQFDEGDSYNMVSPYANDFFAYYRRHIVKVPEPGSYTSGRQVQVETNLFDTDSGKLIWQCQTQSFDQGNTLKVMDQLVKVLVSQMKKDGVIR